MNIRDIAIKNLLRRKAKSTFILAGLVIGVAVVVAVISFVESTAHDINHKMEMYGANILIVPQTDHLTLSYGGMALGGVSFDMQPIRQSEIGRIYNIKNASNVAGVGPIVLGSVNIAGIAVSLAGIDFDSAGILKPWWKIDGQTPGADGLLLGAEAARVIGLSIGDPVELKGHRLQVTGIIASTGSQDDQLIFSHLSTAQAVLNKPDQVSMVEVAALCHDCPVDEMVAQIAEQLPSAKVMPIQQVVKGRMETLSHFKQFSYALSVVVVAVGGLVVLVTLMGSVKERTREIGILRAVGFRKSHVMRIIFMEAALISFLAGIVGFAIGIGGVQLGFTLFGEATPPLHVDPLLGAGAIFMAMAVGLLSSAYPAVTAARMDPNEALKAL
jgi:putative ABC transport system permease protein